MNTNVSVFSIILASFKSLEWRESKILWENLCETRTTSAPDSGTFPAEMWKTKDTCFLAQNLIFQNQSRKFKNFNHTRSYEFLKKSYKIAKPPLFPNFEPPKWRHDDVIGQNQCCNAKLPSKTFHLSIVTTPSGDFQILTPLKIGYFRHMMTS